MAKACQLFSGSSGNSILISSKGHNFLVDIGVSAKRCEQALRAVNVEPDSIDAVFITHEHKDHACGVRVFANRYNTPVFATESCIDEMVRQGLVDERVNIKKMECRLDICDVTVKSFKLSHDSVDCVGYRFDLADGRSISVCTDTGYITDNAKDILLGTDMIFIESNHETSMVETGPYPYYLKKRILGTQGHLSNFACGEYIKELAASGTTRFVLSHLSRENNYPHIAKQTAVSALAEMGLKEDIDYRIYVSSPENQGRGIVL